MNGWECKLNGLPDFAIVSGPNGSGKTAFLQRIRDVERRDGNLVIVLNWDNFLKFRAGFPEEDSNAGTLLLDFFMLVLEDVEEISIRVGSCVVLVDDTSGLLKESQMAPIYTKLMELYFMGRVSRAYITRVGPDSFKVRNMIREDNFKRLFK